MIGGITMPFDDFDNLFDSTSNTTDFSTETATFDSTATGANIFDNNSQFAGSIQPNIFGGENIFDSNSQLVGSTQPNIFGGETIFDNNSQQIGTTVTAPSGLDPFSNLKLTIK